MADNMNLNLDTPDGCKITSTTLEANHILHVTAEDGNGQSATASLDLDTIIGNVNGALSLGHNGFSSQARNVTLADDGETLDAELPDANGDYSTSSISIQHTLGFINGEPRLLMACGFPHSTAHANADTVPQADAQVKDSAQIVNGDVASVANVVTLSLPDSYQMDNPNSAWVKQNLGPYGHNTSAATKREAVKIGLDTLEVGMEIAHGCSIM